MERDAEGSTDADTPVEVELTHGGVPPPGWLRLNNLQRLWLPDNFGDLRGILRLFLAHNQLRTLPENFGHLVELQEFWLGCNHLTSLPDSFGQLSQLQAVFSYSIEIGIIPISF